MHVGYDGHAFRREQQLGIGPLAREARAQTGNERTVRAVRFAARMGLYGALGAPCALHQTGAGSMSGGTSAGVGGAWAWATYLSSEVSDTRGGRGQKSKPPS